MFTAQNITNFMFKITTWKIYMKIYFYVHFFLEQNIIISMTMFQFVNVMATALVKKARMNA